MYRKKKILEFGVDLWLDLRMDVVSYAAILCSWQAQSMSVVGNFCRWNKYIFIITHGDDICVSKVISSICDSMWCVW